MTDILDPVASGEAGNSSAAAIRDMATELRDMRRADGIYDGIGLQPAKDNALETGVLPDYQESQSIPVRVARAVESTNTDSLAQKYIERSQAPSFNAEVARKLTDAGIDDGQLERAAEFSEGVAAQLEGARTLAELKSQADVYLTRGIVEKDDWYQAMPGSSKGQIIMERLEAARQKLEHGGAVEAASARVSKAFDGIKERAIQTKEIHAERKEQKATEKEYDDFDKEMDDLRTDIKAERGKEIGAQRKLEEIRAARLSEETATAQDRQILERPPLAELIAKRKAEAAAPFTAKIQELNARHTEVRSRVEARGLGPAALSEIDKKYTLEKTALYKESNTAQQAAEAKVQAEHKLYEKVSVDQIERLMDFEKANNPEPHVFTPNSEMPPEDAADIAGANSEMMGKLTPPLQVDEYKLGDSVMQRMVFLTGDKRTVIVEDWDKTSGKLKRQAILKGDKLLIPDYENEGLGRIRSANRRRSGKSREVLDDKIYAGLGVIKKKQVKSDSGTSYAEGYSSYTKNLVRSGTGGMASTREYAKHDYKSKKNKGFIAMLQEEWAKSKKK